MNAIVEFFKNSASIQIISFLNYLRATIRANFLVSALNTNCLISVRDQIDDRTLYSGQILYIKITIDSSSKKEYIGCSNTNQVTAVGFLNISNNPDYTNHWSWSKPGPDNPLVSGFFTGCTPLEAILQSSLDCLYIIECLQLLMDKFPAINKQVCITLFYLSYIFFSVCLDALELDQFCSIFKATSDFCKRSFR